MGFFVVASMGSNRTFMELKFLKKDEPVVFSKF